MINPSADVMANRMSIRTGIKRLNLEDGPIKCIQNTNDHPLRDAEVSKIDHIACHPQRSRATKCQSSSD